MRVTIACERGSVATGLTSIPVERKQARRRGRYRYYSTIYSSADLIFVPILPHETAGRSQMEIKQQLASVRNGRAQQRDDRSAHPTTADERTTPSPGRSLNRLESFVMRLLLALLPAPTGKFNP